MRFRKIAVTLAGVALFAALGALAMSRSSSSSSSRRPNVILILIDTLRADRLGSYGNPRGLTPFLDELAARGTVFLNAYSTTSWTSPAVASLFTSRWPSQHGIVNYNSKLGEAEVTLGERLQQGGYECAGFAANGQISSERGFTQGFGFWWAGALNQDVRAANLRGRALWWLHVVKQSSANDPKFLYLHYLEPHSPYEPPEPYRTRFGLDGVTPAEVAAVKAKFETTRKWQELGAREIELMASYYDGEVAALDAELRTLFAELESSGVLQGSVVIVTADHGEEFAEHGSFAHGLTLYEELIRVPLIVVAPGRPGGGTVRENVSLVDVAPTVLELADFPADPHFEGRSLAPLLGARASGSTGADGWWAALRSRLIRRWGTSKEAAPAETIVELLPNGSAYDLRRHAAAIIEDRVKLIVSSSGVPQVYDLGHDPHEREQASESPDGRRQQLMHDLERTRADLGSRAAAKVETVQLDKATKERLRALGYDVGHLPD